MPSTAQVKNNFSLAKGFISDASYISFPEDATVDELNFSIEKDGSRKKRAGLDITYTGVLSQIALSSTAGLTSLTTSSYVWNNPDNQDKKFLVHQINDILYVYDITTAPTDYTSDLVYSRSLVSLADIYSLSNSWVIGDYSRLQYSAGAGFLFITASGLRPFVLIWDEETSTLSLDAIQMRIRDFEGLDSVEASTSYNISIENYYNLKNAGWPSDVLNTYDQHMDPILYYLWATNEEPGTEKPWYFGKITNSGSAEDIGRWARYPFDESEFGTSESLKGSIITDPWGANRTYSALNDSVIYETVTMAGRDSADAWSTEKSAFLLSTPLYSSIIEGSDLTTYQDDRQPFVGSAFYSGRFFVASGDTVYYSQIITKYTDAGKFYQANDPTNELINELLESDGGTIKIPNAGRIVTMKEYATGILIFSSNGVWMISGGDVGFTAKSFKVDKISSTPCRSHYNIIDIENIVVLYNEFGVYTIQPNDAGQVTLQDVTEGTISTFYTNIGLSAVVASKPIYDPINKELLIFYCDIDNVDTTQRYNKILGIKLPSWAFFKYTLSAEDSPRDAFVYDAYLSPLTYSISSEYVVTDSTGDDVVDGAGEDVTISGTLSSPTLYRLIMLSMVGNATTPTLYYSKETIFDPSKLSDFESITGTGIEYEGYLHAGYIVADDILRFKQAPYVQCAFNRTETRFIDNGSGGIEFDRPSSCLLQAYWDWTDHANSGKIDNSQEAYRFTRPYIGSGINDPFDNGYPVVTTKNKVRGRGRALHLKFTSPAGYDCHMLGWGMLMQGGSTV